VEDLYQHLFVPARSHVHPVGKMRPLLTFAAASHRSAKESRARTRSETRKLNISVTWTVTMMNENCSNALKAVTMSGCIAQSRGLLAHVALSVLSLSVLG
jgi:hypothetical protein